MICQNRSGPSGAILWGTYFSMDLQLFLVLLLIVLPPQHMLLFLLLIKLILLCTCLMFLLLPSHLLLLLLILVFLLLLSPPPSRPLLPRVSIPPSLLLVCLYLSLSLFIFHSPCISKYIPCTPSIVTAIPPCPSPRHTSQRKLRFEPIHVILHQMNLMRKQTRHLAGARQSGPPAGLARRPSGRPPAQLLHDADGASH